MRRVTKGSEYAVREDVCLAVRQARARLIHYPSDRDAAFKLRFDKLQAGDNVYTSDNMFDSAKNR